MRRDGPETATGHIHPVASNAYKPNSAAYSRAPVLTQLAVDLSKLDHVRSERVADVEQRLRKGIYTAPDVIDKTAQSILELLAPSDAGTAC